MSPRVVDIGGIFFKARDPERQRAWYREHLGLAVGWIADPEGNRLELWEPPKP